MNFSFQRFVWWIMWADDAPTHTPTHTHAHTHLPASSHVMYMQSQLFPNFDPSCSPSAASGNCCTVTRLNSLLPRWGVTRTYRHMSYRTARRCWAGLLDTSDTSRFFLSRCFLGEYQKSADCRHIYIRPTHAYVSSYTLLLACCLPRRSLLQ